MDHVITARSPQWVWPSQLGRLDVEAGIRAGICVLVPLMVLLLVESSQLSAYVAFAAFTSLYGRYEAYRPRLATVATAGTSFLVIIAAAMLLSLLGGGVVAVAVGLFIISALGVVLSSYMRWVPFGSVFFVFAFSVISAIPVTPAEFLPRYGISVATVLFCVLVAMSGWLVRRTPGRHQSVLSRLRPVERSSGAWRDGVVWLHAGENALGVVVALLIASGMGLSHSYWAAVAVAACVPRPYAPRKVTKIIQRIIGTALGVVVTGLILLTGPPVWAVIVCAAVCQFLAELFVGKVYWFALLFITPLALLVGQLSAAAPVEVILTDRVLDTTIGGLVALVLVLAGTGTAVTWKAYRQEAAQRGAGPA